MHIVSAVIFHLLAQTAVTALVDQRIDAGIAKQTVVKPYIVVTKVDAVEPKVRGSQGLVNPRVQVSCFGSTWTSANNVAAAVKTALNKVPAGLMGGASGVYVLSSFFEGDQDLREESTGLYHVPVDFTIWHRE